MIMDNKEATIWAYVDGKMKWVTEEELIDKTDKEQKIKQANEIIKLSKQLMSKMNSFCDRYSCDGCKLECIEDCGRYSDIAYLEETK